MIEGVFGLLLDDWTLGVQGQDLLRYQIVPKRILGSIISYHKRALESRYQDRKEKKSSLAIKRVGGVVKIVEHTADDQSHLDEIGISM